MTRPILLVAAARAASLVLGVLLLGLLGRRLGPAGFGTLQFALAVMVYPALLVDLGLTTLGLREIARGSPPLDVIRGIVGARVTLAAVVVVAVVTAAVILPLAAETRLILVALTLGVPGSALNARWVLQGEQRFGRSAFAEVVTTGTQLVAVLAVVQGTSDAVNAALALTLATWVTALTSVALAGQWRRFRPRIDRNIGSLIAASLPLGAAAIAISIYYSVDTVLLGLFRSPDEVAYYAAAYRIILPILALAGAVGTVAIPRLSHLEQADPASANEASARLSRTLILWALPIAAGGAIAGGPILQTIYGPEFASAATPFRILVLSVLTVYANAAFAFLMLAKHSDRRYLTATATGAALNVGLNVVVIPLAGMIGAAVTTIVSEVAVLGLILWWTRSVSRTALLGTARVAALPIVAMAAVIWPLRDSLLAIPAGAVVYGLVLVLTGTIPVARLMDRSRRWGI
jgi:O-antigen/teichoic acid export membrane protein